MHKYTYNSDIGTFEIKEIENETYELWLEDELLGSYKSAKFAAEDVSNFNTGYIEWDKFQNELHNFPSNLRKWTIVKEASPQ